MSNKVKPDDELLGINDAANLSGHSIATYRWYRATGTGPKSWKCGRYVRYWRSDVVAWMSAQESTTARGGGLPAKQGG
jgi:predicted DNA-binding transcriptional regulator AlpA